MKKTVLEFRWKRLKAVPRKNYIWLAVTFLLTLLLFSLGFQEYQTEETAPAVSGDAVNITYTVSRRRFGSIHRLKFTLDGQVYSGNLDEDIAQENRAYLEKINGTSGVPVWLRTPQEDTPFPSKTYVALKLGTAELQTLDSYNRSVKADKILCNVFGSIFLIFFLLFLTADCTIYGIVKISYRKKH